METFGDRIQVRVEGLLDSGAVDALAANLRGAKELVLDFFRAPKCSDATLGYLLERLSLEATTLRLRGLSTHQERLLRYLSPADARPAQEPLYDADSADDGLLILTNPAGYRPQPRT